MDKIHIFGIYRHHASWLGIWFSWILSVLTLILVQTCRGIGFPQIKDESRKFSAGSGIRSVVVYGGTSTSHQREQLVRKGANVLIATPGRLLQFVDEGIVKFDKLRLEKPFCCAQLFSRSQYVQGSAKKGVPRLRESRLPPSGRGGGASSRNLGPTF